MFVIARQDDVVPITEAEGGMLFIFMFSVPGSGASMIQLHLTWLHLHPDCLFSILKPRESFRQTPSASTLLHLFTLWSY